MMCRLSTLVMLLLGITASSAVIVAPGIERYFGAMDYEMQKKMGCWSKWWNSDNPWGQGWEIQRDDETLKHIKKAGTKCYQSVACDKPLMMDVGLSDKHMKRNPRANITRSLGCAALTSNALQPDTGFFCDNVLMRQVQVDEGVTPECLKSCREDGMNYKHGDADEWPEENCAICADYKVRYFCMFAAMKPQCTTKTGLTQACGEDQGQPDEGGNNGPGKGGNNNVGPVIEDLDIGSDIPDKNDVKRTEKKDDDSELLKLLKKALELERR